MNHATGIDNTVDVFLDSFEAHVLTTLTLQMIDHSGQSRKLSSAAAVRAVVELLLVDRGAEVLVQGCEFAEEAVAKIALVGFDKAVPCPLGGLVAGGARPSEQLLGDDAIGIAASDSLVELVTVKRGLRARATVQVVN